jgi:hypothetical protein
VLTAVGLLATQAWLTIVEPAVAVGLTVKFNCVDALPPATGEQVSEAKPEGATNPLAAAAADTPATQLTSPPFGDRPACQESTTKKLVEFWMFWTVMKKLTVCPGFTVAVVVPLAQLVDDGQTSFVIDVAAWFSTLNWNRALGPSSAGFVMELLMLTELLAVSWLGSALARETNAVPMKLIMSVRTSAAERTGRDGNPRVIKSPPFPTGWFGRWIPYLRVGAVRDLPGTCGARPDASTSARLGLSPLPVWLRPSCAILSTFNTATHGHKLVGVNHADGSAEAEWPCGVPGRRAPEFRA